LRAGFGLIFGLDTEIKYIGRSEKGIQPGRLSMKSATRSGEHVSFQISADRIGGDAVGCVQVRRLQIFCRRCAHRARQHDR
jgi:hypothetical protein